MNKWILAVVISLAPMAAQAWDGYDYDAGAYVEIGQGNLVREGSSIEIYDYGAGEYREVEVQSITGYGSSVEVEVYDPEMDEYRTLDMDGN